MWDTKTSQMCRWRPGAREDIGESKEKDGHQGGLTIQRLTLQECFDALIEVRVLKIQSNSGHSEIYGHMIKTYFFMPVTDLIQYRH